MQITAIPVRWITLTALLTSACIVPDNYSAADRTTTGAASGVVAGAGQSSNGGAASSMGGKAMGNSGGGITGGGGSLANGGALGGASVNDAGGRSGAGAAGALAAGGSAIGGKSTGGAPNGGNPTGGTLTTGGTATGGTLTTGGTATGGTLTTGGTATGGVAIGGATIGSGGVAGTNTFPPGILAGCNLLMHLDEATWNGTAGEVRDTSGYGNHGTATPGASTTNAGKFGRAGNFYGSGFVDVGDNPSLRPTSAFTVSAWFNATNVAGAGSGIVAKRWGWSNEATFTVFLWGGGSTSADNTRIYVDVDDDDSRFSSDPTKPIQLNLWYHVVVVFDGAMPEGERVRLYVNGALDGSPRYEATASIPNTEAYDGPLQIGNLRDGGANFIGYIDEVAMWRRALSPSEVTALYWATGPL